MRFDYTDSPLLKFMEGRNDIETAILNKYGFVNASPELILFWKEMIDRLKPIDILPYNVQGFIDTPPVSDMFTYDPKIIYVAMHFEVSSTASFDHSADGYLFFYDEGNFGSFCIRNESMQADNPNLYFGFNTKDIKNVFFSRLHVTSSLPDGVYDCYRVQGFKFILP